MKSYSCGDPEFLKEPGSRREEFEGKWGKDVQGDGNNYVMLTTLN